MHLMVFACATPSREGRGRNGKGKEEGWEGEGVRHQCVTHADSLKNIPNIMTLISAIRIAHLSHRRSIFSGERQAHIGGYGT